VRVARRAQILARSVLRKLRPSPANAAKQRVVLEYARRGHLHVLVETGTYLGDMLAAARPSFRELYSIELDEDLYDWARWRFRRAPEVRLYRGDSADVLPTILARVSEPCLFWLDAHASGGITAHGEAVAPVMRELQLILSHGVPGHVILIDDAEAFTGAHGYPSLDEIGRAACGRHVESAGGIVRITPGP